MWRAQIDKRGMGLQPTGRTNVLGENASSGHVHQSDCITLAHGYNNLNSSSQSIMDPPI